MKLSANDRFLAAVKLLVDSNDYVSVEEIADFLDSSKRSIYYIISDINANTPFRIFQRRFCQDLVFGV